MVADPAKFAVPSPLSMNVSPAGRAPVTVIAGAGYPVVVIVKNPEAPVVNGAEGVDVTATA